MATNPFVKKTWQNRLSEFPTRRRLTDVDTGNEQVVDFTREEGQIYTEGDGFTQGNMNNLEQRIFDAFDNFDGMGAAIHTIPRMVPKDITQYYQDGSLWDRLQGRNGYDVCEDVFVGDYFKMTQTITCPGCEQGYGGTDYVRIADIVTHRNTRYLVLIPSVPASTVSSFGVAQFNDSDSLDNIGLYNSNLFVNEIGYTNDTSSNNTIVKQLMTEFGDHLKTDMLMSLADGTMSGETFNMHANANLVTPLLSSINVVSYPFNTIEYQNDQYSMESDGIVPTTSQLSLFKFMNWNLTPKTHPDPPYTTIAFLLDLKKRTNIQPTAYSGSGGPSLMGTPRSSLHIVVRFLVS